MRSVQARGSGVLIAAAAASAALLPSGAVRAAPAPVVLATCGDSALEVSGGAEDGAATLHGRVVTPAGERWTFSASLGLVRIGLEARTLLAEEVRTLERTPARAGKDVAPSGLIVDLLIEARKLIIRHASEGGSDPAYALDLGNCQFGRDGEGALAALVPPPIEPTGCAPDLVRARYRPQVERAARLTDDDADRAARALCEDHQKTIAARDRLERAISDRAARARVAARGAAVSKTEDARMQAWNQVDRCLAGAASPASGVSALHDGEARTRSCYARIAALAARAARP